MQEKIRRGLKKINENHYKDKNENIFVFIQVKKEYIEKIGKEEFEKYQFNKEILRKGGFFISAYLISEMEKDGKKIHQSLPGKKPKTNITLGQAKDIAAKMKPKNIKNSNYHLVTEIEMLLLFQYLIDRKIITMEDLENPINIKNKTLAGLENLLHPYLEIIDKKVSPIFKNYTYYYGYKCNSNKTIAEPLNRLKGIELKGKKYISSNLGFRVSIV